MGDDDDGKCTTCNYNDNNGDSAMVDEVDDDGDGATGDAMGNNDDNDGDAATECTMATA